MTAQATAQRSSASVETEIRSLVSQRSTVESQQQKLSRRLLEIDAEIAQLKPRYFEGDTKSRAGDRRARNREERFALQDRRRRSAYSSVRRKNHTAEVRTSTAERDRCSRGLEPAIL